MRSKITIVLIMVVVALASYTFCLAETSTTKMPPSPVPMQKQIVGKTEASLGPTRYPSFFQDASDNPNCGAYLKAECTDPECTDPLANGIGNGVADSGLTLAPLWLKSTQNPSGQPALATKTDFVLMPGLQELGFTLPSEYRSSSKVLITWTVRIEGYAVAAYNPSPNLCGSWHGTSSQTFPAGQAHTRLYVNGTIMGSTASMTIPNGGIVTVDNPLPPPIPISFGGDGGGPDPTLTGSYLLTKEDFGGAFPDKMDIEIRWYNDTCLRIESPAKMRSLNITTVPLTKQ